MLRVRPKLDYVQLGTSVRLSSARVYDAIHAVNQPGYKKRRAIFVMCDGWGNPAGDPEESVGLLLEGDEYSIVKETRHV